MWASDEEAWQNVGWCPAVDVHDMLPDVHDTSGNGSEETRAGRVPRLAVGRPDTRNHVNDWCGGELFAFLDPELAHAGSVPSTTNRLEGGADSVIKRMLLIHHGLPETHMRRACEWACYMRTTNPSPTSLITPETHDGRCEPARQDGNDDDNGSPRCGTGINWNELHARTPW